MAAQHSESPTEPEKESPMTVVTHRACNFDGSEYRVHHDASRNVQWKTGRANAVRKLVGLSQLKQAEEVDRTA